MHLQFVCKCGYLILSDDRFAWKKSISTLYDSIKIQLAYLAQINKFRDYPLTVTLIYTGYKHFHFTYVKWLKPRVRDVGISSYRGILKAIGHWDIKLLSLNLSHYSETLKRNINFTFFVEKLILQVIRIFLTTNPSSIYLEWVCFILVI